MIDWQELSRYDSLWFTLNVFFFGKIGGKIAVGLTVF